MSNLTHATERQLEQIIEKAIADASEHIMVLDSNVIGWKAALLSSNSPKANEIWFVIYPALGDGYRWECIPKTSDSNFGDFRKPIPKSWMGLSFATLQQKTNVATAMTLDMSGGTAETLEDAIKLAKLVASTN